MGDTLTLQVSQRIIESSGVAGFILTDPQGRSLPFWEPGAHVDLHLDRPGDATLIRQYSLCGDPDDLSHYRVAVLREENGGGGSRHLHENVRAGQLVRVSPPRDNFRFALAPHMVFVAGGIGITPILPMLTRAARAGVDWRLHYAARTPESLAFLPTMADYGDRVQTYVSSEGRRIDVAAVVAEAAADGATMYACGPHRLLEDLEGRASSAGVDLRVERFVNEQAVSTDADHPFEVLLALSRKTLTVQPGESILDKVAEAGVPAPSSCRGGTCGTCETFVLEGRPDHRDAVLNAKEREESEVMMICVSRCEGDRLVLEL